MADNKNILSPDLENVGQDDHLQNIAVFQLLYGRFLPHVDRIEGREHKYKFNYFLLNDLVCSRWRLISFRANSRQICLDSHGSRYGVALVLLVAFIKYNPSRCVDFVLSTLPNSGRLVSCASYL